MKNGGFELKALRGIGNILLLDEPALARSEHKRAGASSSGSTPPRCPISNLQSLYYKLEKACFLKKNFLYRV